MSPTISERTDRSRRHCAIRPRSEAYTTRRCSSFSEQSAVLWCQVPLACSQRPPIYHFQNSCRTVRLSYTQDTVSSRHRNHDFAGEVMLHHDRPVFNRETGVRGQCR